MSPKSKDLDRAGKPQGRRARKRDAIEKMKLPELTLRNNRLNRNLLIALSTASSTFVGAGLTGALLGDSGDLLQLGGIASVFLGIAISTPLFQSSSWWMNSKSVERIYRAAGIDRTVNIEIKDFEPGTVLDRFDHSFPDGRSGKVSLISTGYDSDPQVLFSELAPSVFMEAEPLTAGSIGQKELTA